jgi:hypothetical protein
MPKLLALRNLTLILVISSSVVLRKFILISKVSNCDLREFPYFCDLQFYVLNLF